MEGFFAFSFVALILTLLSIKINAASAAWMQAHATFYGGSDAAGTMGMFSIYIMTRINNMSLNSLFIYIQFYANDFELRLSGGACGYGNLYTDGYGTKTAALSTVLFNNGKSCGGCYHIVCDGRKVPQWCRRGTSIIITATNFCPPNYDLPNDNGGWCNPPQAHFDMSQPAFESIAIYRAGIVPVLYRKYVHSSLKKIAFLFLLWWASSVYILRFLVVHQGWMHEKWRP